MKMKPVHNIREGNTVRIKFLDKYAGGLTLSMAHDMLASKMVGKVANLFSQHSKCYAHVTFYKKDGGTRTWMFDVNALVKIK